MLPSDFIESFDAADLPSEPLRSLAAQIGVSNVAKLWDAFRGRNISFPASFPRKTIAKWLRRQNRLSISEAAWKLGVSSRTISAIANEIPAPAKSGSTQMSLF
jgi:hypothetical protein